MNCYRWNFGVVAPKSCSVHVAVPWCRGASCYFVAPSAATLCIRLRYLHVARRSVTELRDGALHRVGALDVEGERHAAWEEGLLAEQDFELSLSAPGAYEYAVSQPGGHEIEWLRRTDGSLAGNSVRESRPLLGSVRTRTERVESSHSLYCVSFSVENRSWCAPQLEHDEAMLSSLVNAHFILSLDSGELMGTEDRGRAFSAIVAHPLSPAERGPSIARHADRLPHHHSE